LLMPLSIVPTVETSSHWGQMATLRRNRKLKRAYRKAGSDRRGQKALEQAAVYGTKRTSGPWST